MNPQMTAALIAAAVSLLVAGVSLVASRKSLESQREKHERELQRRLTEKLLEIRLEVYPDAFEATAGLRSGTLKNTDNSAQVLRDALDSLLRWNSSRAALVLSEASLQRFYDLRRLLTKAVYKSNPSPGDLLLEEIWRAKVRFRRSLRADINILHAEEVEKVDFFREGAG